MKILEKFNPVLREINTYFGFLFDKGYKVRCSSFKQLGMTFWRVILEGPKCLIQIFQDRSEIFLTFAPLNTIIFNGEDFSLNDQIGLKTMVYYVSKGSKLIGIYENEFYRNRKNQFILFASLLKDYHEQILPYFSNYEFQRYKEDLHLASKEYSDVLYKKYVHENQEWETFDKSNF